MAQITWRNVANTVTGNPAAALSSASSAFASAGVGAQRLLTNSLERQKLERAQTTDDALQSIFGEGDLAGIDQDANFGAILKAQQDKLTGDAQIGADQARQAVSAEQLRVSGIKNSPEALAAASKLAQSTSSTAALRASTAAQQAQNVTDAYARESEDRLEEEAVNTQWDQFIGERTSQGGEFASQEIQRITDTPITADYTIADQARELDSVRNDHAAYVAEARRTGALAFTNQYQIANPGKNAVGRPFDIRDVLSEESKAREKIRFETEQDRQAKQQDALGSTIAGGKKNLYKIGLGAGNEPYALDKGDFGGNKITSNRAISDVKALAGDKWFVDDKLAERYENHIKEVVRITGGNRQIYNEVMKDVAYNRDTAFLGFIGGEDDIEGLPDLGDVEDRVADIIARAEALFEGEKPDKIQSATDRLFNR